MRLFGKKQQLIPEQINWHFEKQNWHTHTVTRMHTHIDVYRESGRQKVNKLHFFGFGKRKMQTNFLTNWQYPGLRWDMFVCACVFVYEAAAYKHKYI